MAHVVRQAFEQQDIRSRADNHVLILQVRGAAQHAYLSDASVRLTGSHTGQMAEVAHSRFIIFVIEAYTCRAQTSLLHVGVAVEACEGGIFGQGVLHLPQAVVTVRGVVMGIGAVASAVAVAGEVGSQAGRRLAVVAEHVLQLRGDVCERVFSRGDTHLRLVKFLGIRQVLADVVRSYINLLQSVQCCVGLFGARIVIDGALEGADGIVVLLEVTVYQSLLEGGFARHVRIGIAAQQAVVRHDSGFLLIVLDIGTCHLVEGIVGIIGLRVHGDQTEHLLRLVDVLVLQAVGVACLEGGIVCTGSSKVNNLLVGTNSLGELACIELAVANAVEGIGVGGL